MLLETRVLELPRKRPLTISRGTSGASTNLFVTVSHDGVDGYGELAPIGYGEGQDAQTGQRELEALADDLRTVAPNEVATIERVAKDIHSAPRSALVCACYDWLGKRAGMALPSVLGLPSDCPPTSITVGIMPAQEAADLAPRLLEETGTTYLKLKLGSPDGIESDMERFSAVKQAVPEGSRIRVDANGGWSPRDAVAMVTWLADRGCDYVEQPLGFGFEDALPSLLSVRRIPIFLDEFIATSRDVAKHANNCDGVNVKLMKSGGIAEAIRIVHTAKAHGLMTMIGCFGETSVGISAGVAIGALFDHIDLDSHLNMQNDPANGLSMVNGIPTLSGRPGLGVEFL